MLISNLIWFIPAVSAFPYRISRATFQFGHRIDFLQQESNTSGTNMSLQLASDQEYAPEDAGTNHRIPDRCDGRSSKEQRPNQRGK